MDEDEDLRIAMELSRNDLAGVSEEEQIRMAIELSKTDSNNTGINEHNFIPNHISFSESIIYD
jgi:hypothetical protein